MSKNIIMLKTPGNNTLEVQNSITGKEVILYNGTEVSSERTITGGVHQFTVTEQNEKVNYEVELGQQWNLVSVWVTVKRNGELIFSSK